MRNYSTNLYKTEDIAVKQVAISKLAVVPLMPLSNYLSTLYLVFQVLSLLPVYLLELCYGMNSGFTAILTPQLYGPCSEFHISLDQLSWIGKTHIILNGVVK